MGPKFRIVSARDEDASSKENKKPNFSRRPAGLGATRMRHHNPGTTYRPDPRLYRRQDKKIRVLSSVIVVPPKMQKIRITSCQPSTSKTTTNRDIRPKINEIEEKWRRPKPLKLSPMNSIWRKERGLTPTPSPKIDYRAGFRIYPGEAYQPVLWYEDTSAHWPPPDLEIAEPERPRVHDATGIDPRSVDLRVHLNRLKITDLRDKINEKRQRKNCTPLDTPEQAVARLHGEEDSTSIEKGTTTSIIPAESPEQTIARLQKDLVGAATSANTHTRPEDVPWPTPGRRRRRCRLIIIYDKPQ